MDHLELLNTFKRNRLHICKICRSEEITVEDVPYDYYCSHCFENVDTEDMSRLIFFYNCAICDKEDLYGSMFNEDGVYSRLCKKCFEDKVYESITFNVKPAKR